MSLNFAVCRVLYISLCQLRTIMLCPITDTLIYINVFEFCILQSIIYIIVSAACHNVMCHLDPHKTSMLSMLNSAHLFSLQPATSLSSRPACNLSSCPRSRAHREARPSWRHQRSRVSRPWKGGARSRC